MSSETGGPELRNQCAETCERARLCAICAGGITEQEPVAEIQAEDMGRPFNATRVTTHFYAEVPAVGTKLYTAPPKREWVGLTDEERSYYLQSASNVGWWQAAKMIEAKLREKNT